MIEACGKAIVFTLLLSVCYAVNTSDNHNKIFTSNLPAANKILNF